MEINEIKKITVNFNKAKEHIVPRLYHEREGEELFFSMKNEGFEDLIAVLYLDFKDGKAVKVTPSLLKMWGIGKDEAFEIAKANFKMVCLSMFDIFKTFDESLGIEGDVADSTFVFTNENQVYGAYAAVAGKERMREFFPNGFVILPSSIHEVIVRGLSDDESVETLKNIINDVNMGFVAEDERLSDHPYVFV